MFTRDEIAAAALKLIDQGGLEALSMRALAAELGVGTMSIYRYFDTKEALLDAVTEAAMPKFRHARPGASDWQRELRGVFTDLRRGLERHPGLVRMRLDAVPRTERALAWTESVLRLLTTAGFSRKQAVGAYRALYTYTFGFAAFAAAETKARGSVEHELEALPRADYPELVNCARELTQTLGAPEQFEFGLRRLLNGIAELLPEA